MMKKNNNLYVLTLSLLTICIILLYTRISQGDSSIKIIDSYTLTPYNFGFLSQEMDSKNLNIREFQKFSNDTGQKILEVNLSSDGCCILAVDDGGFLYIWNIAKGQKISRYKVFSGELFSMNFSANGEKLFTASKEMDVHGAFDAIVWDTRTGEINFCNGRLGTCPPENFMAPMEEKYFLDPTGEWLFGYHIDKSTNANTTSYWNYSFSPSIYNIYGVNKYYNEDSLMSGSESLDDEKYYQDANAEVIAMTTDVKAEYIAYGFANGVVRFRTLYDLPTSKNRDSAYHVDYEQAYQAERINIIDMKIDNTRNWLAVVSNKELLVWNLQRGKIFPLAIREQVSEAIALCFDQRGDFLVLAQKDKILFYDLNLKKSIETIDANGISSLHISADNRLLIWGDKEGNAHLWGVP